MFTKETMPEAEKELCDGFVTAGRFMRMLHQDGFKYGLNTSKEKLNTHRGVIETLCIFRYKEGARRDIIVNSICIDEKNKEIWYESKDSKWYAVVGTDSEFDTIYDYLMSVTDMNYLRKF